MYTWQRLATAFFIVAAAALAISFGVRKDVAGLFVMGLVLVAAAGTGALIGCVIDWLRYRRSPLAPLFSGRFGWFYRRRFWFRFALAFALAWSVFIAITLAVAAAAGATDEMTPFFSMKGGFILLAFLVIFFIEGAVVGGIVDVALYLFRTGRRG